MIDATTMQEERDHLARRVRRNRKAMMRNGHYDKYDRSGALRRIRGVQKRTRHWTCDKLDGVAVEKQRKRDKAKAKRELAALMGMTGRLVGGSLR